MICLFIIENINKMLRAQSEIRIIWLMLLMIIGIATWFLEIPVLSYLCALALLVSVMHYVGVTEHSTQQIAQHQNIVIQQTSKVPLYLASILIAAGLFVGKHWMTALGLTSWIFFFLRWLRRLELDLIVLQKQIKHQSQGHHSAQTLSQQVTEQVQIEKRQEPQIQQHPSTVIHTDQQKTDVEQNNISVSHSTTHQQTNIEPIVEKPNPLGPEATDLQQSSQLSLGQQLQQWIFQGNPVLKVAVTVLLMGIVLLLRFATEHWQLDLAVQLAIVGVVCAVVTGLGYWLYQQNRGFALGLEGLGMAGLCLNLFFAYYNQLISSLVIASLLFIGLMLITVRLSLKQQSIELALMAMLIAYIAPFTLPVREISSVELLAYYWIINLAVAVLSSLRPWKVLTQITFLLTLFIATGYGLLHPDADQFQLLIGILAHSAIFIWLGFRYSQLLAKQDLQHFKLNPLLDLALVFGVPIVSYGLIYLIYFQQRFWQAGLSLLFVAIYAALYVLTKRTQAIAVIAQSYLSLTLIFIAFIPPILAEGYWSAMGWAVEALLIFIFALQRESKVARYLAMALSVVAGLSGVYYLLADNFVPRSLYWCLSLVGIAMVLVANCRESFRKQYDLPMLLQHIFQMLSAVSVLMWLIIDAGSFYDPEASLIFFMALALLVINEWMYRTEATWTWWIVQCAAIVPIWCYAIFSLGDYAHAGQLLWPNYMQQTLFVFSGVLLALLLLRTRLALEQTREVSGFAVLVSLSLASLGLVPTMPYVSVVILPVLLALWSWKRPIPQLNLQLIWQSYSSLCLMAVWIISSQLFSQSSFKAYLFPLLNPFDAVSLAMLLCFLWMLTLQLKNSVDRGIIAIMAVLSVLWLSSYILLRALHMYLDTPYNQLSLWQDATVQFSLTLLWVSLAFITMTIATKKSIRALWLLGASLLVLVTLKLVLLDLSHIGTLLRVGSFLGAGLIMLIIAYIAPMPEQSKEN